MFWRHPSPAQACRLPPGNKHLIDISLPFPGLHRHPWHTPCWLPLLKPGATSLVPNSRLSTLQPYLNPYRILLS